MYRIAMDVFVDRPVGRLSDAFIQSVSLSTAMHL